MAQLTETDCRRRWDEAIRARGWQKSKLRLAMFDYLPDRDGRTLYDPAPAWPTIADENNTADEADYMRMERNLLAQGEPYSRRGAAAHSGQVSSGLAVKPVPISRRDAVSTIDTVMAKVHPLAVTQEQILRAAFFAQLPRELAETIGTANAAVHPERPTPSSDYVFTGTRGVGMRARYDLGFGHPTESEEIAGVSELKAGPATFDRLETMSCFNEPTETDLGPQSSKPEPDKLDEPLMLDFFKLLDPQLPSGAFRISWIASGKRGRSTMGEIRERAVLIVQRVARERNLAGGVFEIDATTRWLVCSWPESLVRLELAWYRPDAIDPERFEPVFGELSQTSC